MPRPYQIQGKAATDIEYNVALALDRLGWRYDFQVPFGGGRRRPGGTVVDFIVHTIPLPTPLYVHGEYWHRGEESELDRILIGKKRGFRLPVIIYGKEAANVEQARQTLIKKLGFGN